MTKSDRRSKVHKLCAVGDFDRARQVADLSPSYRSRHALTAMVQGFEDDAMRSAFDAEVRSFEGGSL
jgi:hypothetical protein